MYLLFFLVWLFIPDTIILRSRHTIACMKSELAFMAELYSTVQLFYLHLPTSSVDGYLGGFQFFMIANKTAENIYV